MNRLKKKGTIGMLAGIVLLIWGIIFFQIARMTAPVQKEKTTVGPQASAEMTVSPALLLDYRDPFQEIEGMELSKKRMISPSMSRVIQTPVSPPAFRWVGKIRRGVKDFLLIATEHGTRVAGLDEQIEGYAVCRVSTDSIVLMKKHQIFVLYKK